MASRARAALSTMPSYDFLAGSPEKENMPMRQTFRTSSASMAATKAPFKPSFDQENEDLRAEVKKLQYELEAIRSDGQLGVVALERERAQLLSKLEVEGKKAGDLGRQLETLNSKMATMVEELKDERRSRSEEKKALEMKSRDMLALKASAEEEIEEARAELESQKRQSSFQMKELSEQMSTYRSESETLAVQMDEQTALLREAETRGLKYQAEATRFEKEILTLRGQVSSDPAEVDTLRNELNSQVEKTNAAEMARLRLEDELTRLQAQFKSVGIVEEEKRVLEVQLQGMEDLERERDEAIRQKSILQDEKRTWNELLRMNGNADSSDTPESICRELASARIEIVDLKSHIGQLSSELQESEGTKWRAEEAVGKLRNELQALQLAQSTSAPMAETKAPAANENKMIARLERQKNLQVKEIDYLKAQLKTFAEEDLNGALDGKDSSAEDPAKMRISELENMLEQYRTELNDAVHSLRKAEVERPQTPPKTLKRSLDEDAPSQSPSSTARIGELLRKSRSLQDELATATNETKILRVELASTKEQLADFQAQTKTRVLSLRDNPVDNFENWKLSTIKALRTENADLLERITASSTSTNNKSASVPASSLVAAQDRIEELEEELSSRDKRIMRLKQVFGEKTNELRTAIANLLGWNIELLPNNRFSLKSTVYTPAKPSGRKSQRVESPAIIFSGAASGTGTGVGATAAPEMRIADDTFRKEVDGLTKYWIKGRSEIRGLLSAVTLEMLERGREGMTMGIVEAS